MLILDQDTNLITKYLLAKGCFDCRISNAKGVRQWLLPTAGFTAPCHTKSPHSRNQERIRRLTVGPKMELKRVV